MSRRPEGPGAKARPSRKGPRTAPHRAPRRRRAQGLTLGALTALLIAGAVAMMATGPDVPRTPDAQISGRPTRITDGDTLRFGAHRLRLSGIDAPEMATPHGEPARRHLAALVAARGPIACEDLGARTHGRIVARCRTADGADLETLIVEAGWARDFTRHSHGRHLPAQLRAMAAGKGMWAR